MLLHDLGEHAVVERFMEVFAIIWWCCQILEVCIFAYNPSISFLLMKSCELNRSSIWPSYNLMNNKRHDQLLKCTIYYAILISCAVLLAFKDVSCKVLAILFWTLCVSVRDPMQELLVLAFKNSLIYLLVVGLLFKTFCTTKNFPCA